MRLHGSSGQPEPWTRAHRRSRPALHLRHAIGRACDGDHASTAIGLPNRMSERRPIRTETNAAIQRTSWGSTLNASPLRRMRRRIRLCRHVGEYFPTLTMVTFQEKEVTAMDVDTAPKWIDNPCSERAMKGSSDWSRRPVRDPWKAPSDGCLQGGPDVCNAFSFRCSRNLKRRCGLSRASGRSGDAGDGRGHRHPLFRSPPLREASGTPVAETGRHSGDEWGDSGRRSNPRAEAAEPPRRMLCPTPAGPRGRLPGRAAATRLGRHGETDRSAVPRNAAHRREPRPHRRPVRKDARARRKREFRDASDRTRSRIRPARFPPASRTLRPRTAFPRRRKASRPSLPAVPILDRGQERFRYTARTYYAAEYSSNP
jgi:hypothetical protein